MKQTLAAFLLVTALAATPALSQTSTPSTSGVVVSTTADSLVVRMDDGTNRTFLVDPTTALPSDRLAEGNRITVSYRPLDAGRFQAATVALADVPSADNMVAGSGLDRPITATVTTDRDRPTTATVTTDRDRDTNTARTLPQTGSSMPGLALAGSLALMAGLALSAFRRRA